MNEPDVTLTDYFLTLESTLLAVLIWQAPGQSVFRIPFTVFFASAALAALAGGTVHGFFPSDRSRTGALLWRTTLLALGVTALATWVIAARLALPASFGWWVQIAGACGLLAYAIVVITVSGAFWIALAYYLAPTIFLLGSFGASHSQSRDGAMLAGAAGMILTILAAVVQARRLAVHRTYFNHNALYHTIQAVALWLIYRAARALV